MLSIVGHVTIRCNDVGATDRRHIFVEGVHEYYRGVGGCRLHRGTVFQGVDARFCVFMLMG